MVLPRSASHPCTRLDVRDTGYNGNSFQSRQCGSGVSFEGFLVLGKFIDESPLLFCAPPPLVLVSTLENPRRRSFSPPTISAHSQIFLAPTQTWHSTKLSHRRAIHVLPDQGFADDTPHDPDPHGHNTLTPTKDAPGPLDLCSLSRATTLAKPLVRPGLQIVPPNLTGIRLPPPAPPWVGS